MGEMPRSTSSNRALAGLWFAAFALVGTSVFFFPLHFALRAAIFFIILPTVSGGVAGYTVGAAILDSTRVVTVRDALLRGVATAVVAYGLFAVMYAVAVPALESIWSFQQAGAIFLLTISLGLLMGGPLTLVLGVAAGASLYKFARARGQTSHEKA
jgi:hypothetical protein